MKRWIIVDWTNREVLPDAFAKKMDAWRAIVADATKKNQSTNEYDQFEVDCEVL